MNSHCSKSQLQHFETYPERPRKSFALLPRLFIKSWIRPRHISHHCRTVWLGVFFLVQPYTLPTIRGKHEDLKCLSPETVSGQTFDFLLGWLLIKITEPPREETTFRALALRQSERWNSNARNASHRFFPRRYVTPGPVPRWKTD